MERKAPRDRGSFLDGRGSWAGVVEGKSGCQQPYLGRESTRRTLEKLTSPPGRPASWRRAPTGRRVTSRGIRVTAPQGEAIFPGRRVTWRCGEGTIPDLQRAGLDLQRPHLVLQRPHLVLQRAHLDVRRGYLAVEGCPRSPGISPSQRGNVDRPWRRRPRGEGAAPGDRGLSPRGAGTWLEGRGGLPTAGEARLIARCSSLGAR